MKTAIDVYNDFDDFFQSLVDDKITIFLQVSSVVVNAPITLTVTMNNTVHRQISLANETQDLLIELSLCRELNHLAITMEGKKIHDTIVDLNGNILKDTHIKIDQFRINNFDILQDVDFFHDKFYYRATNSDIGETAKDGFWQPATLGLLFNSPFIVWYIDNSKKNTDASDNFQYKESPVIASEYLAKLIKSVKKLNI